jgi:hypothetical protein
MAENDYYRIPILSRDNHETWFQDMSFKLRSKEIFYVVETTMREYAWTKRDNSIITPASKSDKTTTSVESELTNKFEGLGGTYNVEKKRVFERDQAKAFHFISMSLGDNDKGARGEYELDVKGFWISLKAKYQKTSQSMASMYMTKIQTFVFEEQKGIFVACIREMQTYPGVVVLAP